MTNSERLALFAHGTRERPSCSSFQSAHRPSRASVLLCLRYLAFSCIHVCLFSPVSPPHPISGVVSVSLSVVLGVEEDQSESAPAHARHERGAHHPAFSADQVDQENDWWDHRMSAEWCREEYLKIKPAEALSEKKNKKTTRLIILMNFCTSYGPFWEERATFSLCFLLSQHLM